MQKSPEGTPKNEDVKQLIKNCQDFSTLVSVISSKLPDKIFGGIPNGMVSTLDYIKAIQKVAETKNIKDYYSAGYAFPLVDFVGIRLKVKELAEKSKQKEISDAMPENFIDQGQDPRSIINTAKSIGELCYGVMKLGPLSKGFLNGVTDPKDLVALIRTAAASASKSQYLNWPEKGELVDIYKRHGFDFKAKLTELIGEIRRVEKQEELRQAKQAEHDSRRLQEKQLETQRAEAVLAKKQRDILDEKKRQKAERIKRLAALNFRPEDGKIVSNNFKKTSFGWAVEMVMDNGNWTNGTGETKAEAMVDAKGRIIEKDFDHNEYEDYAHVIARRDTDRRHQEMLEEQRKSQYFDEARAASYAQDAEPRVVSIKKSKGKYIHPSDEGVHKGMSNFAYKGMGINAKYERSFPVDFKSGYVGNYGFMAEVTMDNGDWSYGFGYNEAEAVEDAKERIQSGDLEQDLSKWTANVR